MLRLPPIRRMLPPHRTRSRFLLWSAVVLLTSAVHTPTLHAVKLTGTESEAESQGEQGETTKAPIASLATAENPLVTYPNPFNPRTQVSFYVATAGEVRVEVYDVRGRKVKSLLHEAMTVGTHQVTWTGEDDRSRAVAGGVYFVRMRTADGVYQESVALLK